MYLDEELARIEGEEWKRLHQKENAERILKELEEEEENQKTVEQFMEELRGGNVVLDGISYPCESGMFDEGRIRLCVLTEEMGDLYNDNHVVRIHYRKQEMAMLLTYLEDWNLELDRAQFEAQIQKNMEAAGVSYQIFEAEDWDLGTGNVCCLSGVLNSPSGRVFQVDFRGYRNGGLLFGSMNCMLGKMFSYQNFFKAVIKLLYEEEKE